MKNFDLYRHPETGESFETELALGIDGKLNGKLTTASGKYVPVINDIPRFVEIENYASNFGFQWNTYSKTQLDSYSGIRLSENRIKEVCPFPLTQLEGEMVLEAGSGAGRFTEVFLKYKANLHSFDYSTAVEANYMNNHNEDFNLFQGDIFKIPFSAGQFDKVFCLGVIQHTPDPKLAFECLAKQVKPGGMLIIDAYTKNKYSKFTWKYILRPLTKNIGSKKLLSIVSVTVRALLPLSSLFVKLFGRLGTKILPIADFHNIKFPSYEVRKQWSVLDTFDWYSPSFDFPQSLEDIQGYYEQNDFKDVEVFYGSNGVIGRGVKK